MRLSVATALVVSVCASYGQGTEPTTAAVETTSTNSTSSATSGNSLSPAGSSTPIDKRAYGVLPNYRTANSDDPYQPLSAKHKFYIASKDSFDYPILLLGGFFAGLAQIQNEHPTYGQGTVGFAKRYSASFVDQSVGNFLTEGIMPAIFKEDPRYFRVGPSFGNPWKRAGYAATRILVNKTDKGKWDFNYAEVLGNTTVAVLGNAYYPGERTLGDNASRLITQLVTDSVSQVLKEFWPDVKRKLLKKK